jgi:hypothetical protein
MIRAGGKKVNVRHIVALLSGTGGLTRESRAGVRAVGATAADTFPTRHRADRCWHLRILSSNGT